LIDKIQIGRKTISKSAGNTSEWNYHPRKIITHQFDDIDGENEEIKSVMQLEQLDIDL
jgi:hypothetical protein